MQIFYDIEKQDQPCCIALGFFDGAHIGHRTLLSAMNSYARQNALRPCVFTFSDSPCSILGKAESRSLQTLEQRLDNIAEFSRAEVCFAVSFLKYKDLDAKSFVENILIDKLCVKAVFCGFNFRFGKNAEGDAKLLEDICSRSNVKVFVTAPVCSGGETVSSTGIRRLIENGKMLKANALLAQPFRIEGIVSSGKQNGRKMGVPTINQSLPEGFVVPRYGVYASFAVIDGERFRAVSNIGVRPTIFEHGQVNCETHILDTVNGDMYGKSVCTEILWFERDERRFDDLNALAAQIHRDIDHINSLDIYNLYINGDVANAC